MSVRDAELAPTTSRETRDGAGKQKLDVGVAIVSSGLPAWQHGVLSRIAASDYANLAAVFVLSETADKPAPGALTALMRRVVARLDAKIECELDAAEPVDSTSLLRHIPTIDVTAAERDVRVVFDLDLIVDFSGANMPDDLAALARCGVWRFTQPHSVSGDAADAAFWAVHHGWPVSEAVLEMHAANGTRVPLATTAPATHPHSVKLTASAMAWRMASLLVHKLRALHEAGVDALVRDAATESKRVEGTAVRARHAAARAGELALYATRNLKRRARASLERRISTEQWILMFRLAPELCTDPAQFTKIVPPKDCYWADPHLVQRDGRFYAFVEEYPYATGRGRIAVLPIESDGTWSETIPVLERDYHLSYPFVFEDAGELYMVPESSENRTVDLYRCVDFPARWEHVETLLSGVPATDTTLLHAAGRWWLFTNLIEFDGESFSEELYIFYSDSLVGGSWKPHRRNPVVSDARRSRPAGAMIERDGRVLRPAQDCSVRYGYGIRLQQIETLSETDYRETEVARIEPVWDRRIVATHTLAHVPGMTMIDALQPRLRF